MSADEDDKPESVCRTCMSCTSVLQPLFPFPEQISTFVHTLYVTTGLKIQINDGLPQNICKECSKTIEKSMQFRVHCKETENKLLKYFNYVSNSDNENEFDYNNEPELFEIKSEKETNLNNQTKLPSQIEDNQFHKPLLDNVVELHEIESNIADNFVNNIESDNEINKSHQNLLKDTKLLSENDTFFGSNCYSVVKFTTTSMEPIRKKSQRQTHSYDRKRYLELIDGPIVAKQPILCKICKKYSKCLNSFEKHAMSHLGYNILCEFCAKSCISKANLLRHQRRKHGLARDDSFPCPVCQFQAIDKEQLEVHQRKVHTKERPFVCNNCGAAFYSKRVLIQHEANHKTDQPFQCDLCPLKFKLRCQLTKHIHRVHTKNYLKYTYGCYICYKKYSRTHHVRKHLVKIHGVPMKQQDKVQRFEVKNPFSTPFTTLKS